ncbi:hypothetical protein Goshw_028205 [Gossypium schwendimanii]|uniref:Uncharacterized protein n=1 Tax=Gossypium schwendimanii TaxID=34291 RepID=A0A7J9NCU6_GOSSC|nr:hypothetical protein [Gossypium schwendimanii]
MDERNQEARSLSYCSYLAKSGFGIDPPLSSGIIEGGGTRDNIKLFGCKKSSIKAIDGAPNRTGSSDRFSRLTGGVILGVGHNRSLICEEERLRYQNGFNPQLISCEDYGAFLGHHASHILRSCQKPIRTLWF